MVVERSFTDIRFGRDRVHSGCLDPLGVKQMIGGLQNPVPHT
jgi:hypothetical protein